MRSVERTAIASGFLRIPAPACHGCHAQGDCAPRVLPDAALRCDSVPRDGFDEERGWPVSQSAPTTIDATAHPPGPRPRLKARLILDCVTDLVALISTVH